MLLQRFRLPVQRYDVSASFVFVLMGSLLHTLDRLASVLFTNHSKEAVFSTNHKRARPG